MTIKLVRELDRWVSIQTVLISVTDKRGLEVLAPGLASLSSRMRILSTGGTYSRIAELLGPEVSKKHLLQVSDYTGQPETQGGLVKTLDFKIYLGLLTERYNDSHHQDLLRTGALPIDMVVVNLYPFGETVSRSGATLEEARSNIDIGGPCMLRAAAKNFLRVASVSDPGDYTNLIKNLRINGGRIDLTTRFKLAQKAFAHTARYDQTVSEYLNKFPETGVETCYLAKDVPQ